MKISKIIFLRHIFGNEGYYSMSIFKMRLSDILNESSRKLIINKIARARDTALQEKKNLRTTNL